MSTADQPMRDPFFWLGEINKASAVMLVEEKIVPATLGARIAAAVAQVIAEGDKPGAMRSQDYLATERQLVAIGGAEMSRLHSGRSRQDIGATRQAMMMRDDLLAALARLNDARAVLLAMAARHADAILPAYTWGVQAQPISFGHYILAYVEALSRSAERLRQAYARLNLSPLGAAALGTSSFPVNRPRLAELLGFDGVLENSFDANQIAPIDMGAELMGIVAAGTLTIGTMLADITQQYARTEPWLLLAEGEQTGISSIMPQKRNPSGLVFLRAQASRTLGHAQTFLFLAHNVPAGMSDTKPFIDPRQGDQPNSTVREFAALLDGFGRLMKTLEFNAQRALAEVDADYATATELADTLQREGDVPFRVGHRFASELVNFGRSKRLKPAELPYAEAQRLYAETARHLGRDDSILPLREPQFRAALSARNMVAASRGLGGPQPLEVARMLAAESARLQADRDWVNATLAKLEAAQHNRDEAFARLHRTTGQ